MAESKSSESVDLPRKGHVPRADRERQIVSMAERVFARHGFEAASMEEIARECSVDRALIYQYFGGKRELYDACHAAALNELTQSVTRALDGIGEIEGDPARKALMRRAVRAFFVFVEDHGDGWDVLFGAGWSSMGITRSDDHRGLDTLAWVEGLLAISFPDAPPAKSAASAAALLGASWAISLWWRQNDAMTAEEIADHHLEFCLSALEPLRDNAQTQPHG